MKQLYVTINTTEKSILATVTWVRNQSCMTHDCFMTPWLRSFHINELTCGSQSSNSPRDKVLIDTSWGFIQHHLSPECQFAFWPTAMLLRSLLHKYFPVIYRLRYFSRSVSVFCTVYNPGEIVCINFIYYVSINTHSCINKYT